MQVKQDYDKRNKRKSVYVFGSQEQENYTIDDEPTVLQGFIPNTESTRIARSDNSEDMSVDNRSTRSAGKFLLDPFFSISFKYKTDFLTNHSKYV